MNDFILHAQGLTKDYGATRALAGVSLGFVEGTSTAIMGASGSGKTTLLHTLAGIIAPDAGAVDYAGSRITALGDMVAFTGY
ncbi:ATP-binding cassette domain-containing protein [Leucobacter tenebrionis]|uniref:ATP-binding cassette domain-containing protein n=1 Tax=Leucobacter tenebrionis TaxID=2873270 RepID=UPI001CA6B8A3|nr:ATP-binding cassette domain-containing protein [Leucobacter tenebrionis]QZY50816.1 ATP-binding cassette domain-containing protein [Leucobacter tenebrionis]